MANRVYIGIDYGERRIGLAKSDPTGLIASPLKTIAVKSINRAIDEIVSLIEQTGAAGVVIGYPISLSGGDKGESCRKVDRFIERFRKRYEGPMYKIDERFSSAEAENMIHRHNKKIGQDKSRVDRIAAAIILQKFLDERKQAN
ncbi:MAG: Holliday junction resolvase RuvX [Candidatus Zixiibacteriota bacterium]|nr:MAG: Holliday junction resolvase RuvX [candidate division Zixibacteria bacterium]